MECSHDDDATPTSQRCSTVSISEIEAGDALQWRQARYRKGRRGLPDPIGSVSQGGSIFEDFKQQMDTLNVNKAGSSDMFGALNPFEGASLMGEFHRMVRPRWTWMLLRQPGLLRCARQSTSLRCYESTNGRGGHRCYKA